CERCRGNHTSCEDLAKIIGGVVVQPKPCTIMRLRDDIHASIEGVATVSPLVLPFMLTFEPNELNLGETVLLQSEVNPFLEELKQRGMTVTAVHNHWLFEKPRLMYMHWYNIGMNPLQFTENCRAAAKKAGLF